MAAHIIEKLLEEALDEGNISLAGYYASMLFEQEE
jgi:hypothetical protein